MKASQRIRQLEAAIKALAAGKTLEFAADAAGVAPATLASWLDNMDAQSTPVLEQLEETRIEKARKAIESGDSLEFACYSAGIAPETLLLRLENANAPKSRELLPMLEKRLCAIEAKLDRILALLERK